MVGCSLFGGHYQTITIASDPPEADVYLDGMFIGKTPLQHKIHRRNEILLEIREDGYVTAFDSTHETLSGIGTVDVIFGSVLLIPLLGLIGPAAWRQEPESFGFRLWEDEDEENQL